MAENYETIKFLVHVSILIEAFKQEFRLLFREDHMASEFADTIYKLRQGHEQNDSEQGHWEVVEDRQDLDEIDFTLLNIMMSPDLADYRLNAYARF